MFTSLYSIRPMTAGWQIKCIKDDFYEAWTYKHWHFQKVIVSVNLGRSKLKHSEDYMHETWINWYLKWLSKEVIFIWS